MVVIAVVGAQYGGEGKGKIVSYLDSYLKAEYIAKASGPNSCHRVVENDFDYNFRMLPSHVRIGKPNFVFGAGALIDLSVLSNEINLFLKNNKLYIDRQAGVISKENINQQKIDPLYKIIGTTYSGTGTACAERCRRRLKIANEFEELKKYIADSSEILHQAMMKKKNIILEGSQAFGLSNYHGTYPFCTSRDTTVSALCSQLGVPFNLIDKVVLVVSCLPTRNHAGPLENEIFPIENSNTNDDNMNLVVYNYAGIKRRIGNIDVKLVKKAVYVNSATSIALTHVDRLDKSVYGITEKKELTPRITQMISKLESECSIPVSLVSTGEKTSQIIVLNDNL